MYKVFIQFADNYETEHYFSSFGECLSSSIDVIGSYEYEVIDFVIHKLDDNELLDYSISKGGD